MMRGSYVEVICPNWLLLMLLPVAALNVTPSPSLTTPGFKKIRVVENVEKFRAKFQLHPFADQSCRF